MAKSTTPPDLELLAGPRPDPPKPDPEPDPAELYRALAALIRRVSPGATNPRLVWDVPGNSVPASIPLDTPAPDLSETAADILEVLKDAEGWLSGEEVGRRMNPTDPVDHTSGTFKRAIEELKEAKLIDSLKRKGYKAKQLR